VSSIGVASVVVALVMGIAQAPVAVAGDNDGDFEIELTETGSTLPGNGGGTDGSGDQPTRVPCRWFGQRTDEDKVDLLNEIYDVLDLVFDSLSGEESVVFESTFYVDRGMLHQWSVERAQFERYQKADCENATELTEQERRGYRWIAVEPPSPTILVPDVVLVVRGHVQSPQPEINPATETAVNLGLWLAVANTRPVTAEGRLGPLWARGRATLTSTTFDPGNGDAPVVCDGGGTPMPDSRANDAGEGPCGYTYTSLADARNDDLAITITSTWTITWVTSDGTANSSPPETLVLTTTIPYDVYEVQTIGSD
jgi:hypothetical protein